MRSDPQTEAAGPAPRTALLAPFDYALYGITVFVWGTSWIALKMQLGEVSPVVSVFWRFGVAALLMFVWVRIAGYRMRFSVPDHFRFAGLGVLIFSTNFALFYFGGQFLVSGLLSVIFSLASVINVLLAAAIFRQPVEARVVAGASLGFIGIALVFWPEIAGTAFDGAALRGFLLCVGGTLSFCLGNMLSASTQGRGLPVISANAWGMLYGTLFLGAVALLRGDAFVIETTVGYLGSLAWLAVFSSVVAFASYLTLLGRIGSGRAGYATVMFPLVALAISTLVEGYQWTMPAIAGVALVLAGNVIVLSRRRGPACA